MILASSAPAAASGNFFAYVKPSGLLGLFGSRDSASSRIDKAAARYAEAAPKSPQSVSVGNPTVTKFCYPGGAIAVQPGVQAITDHLVRITPYVHNSKDQVLVFFGTLSNLHELCARHHEFSSRGKSVLDPSAASGTGAQTTTCLLRMYQHFAGKEVMMLAELQGQYAFVLYDAVKKQAFAARDPSGSEPLFYKLDTDGAVLFTNDVDSLPTGEADHKGWKELAPGHYMCGRTITQFALSLDGLATRVHKESMDADALHAMLQAEVKAEEEERTFGFGSRPRLSRNRSK
ncbi:hypothetical protein CHLRE_10g441750v5 [Chlamydomonas reinhardtii]|uniref:Glutamine amidotransferase type-2 domain-containing protein n=1 Tax=Chlamydomonas reinhardtii TaxID=3055 RepID=A0A2K3DAJ0_CHLRE|nr:uncharacterized protein CHLRE_10g441750v5 [Chlamydomonas reinhardtii]PNW77555.1 hypothetical protein CHLRE_10g441750v5 [Chlamydomonas reinhardtii]